MSEIWAIVLAAGESKRMGSPKMLLPFNEKTMIETVIDNISASEIDKILVVLGAEKDTIIKLVNRSLAECCYNENYKTGMLSSVQCGFRNLPADMKAALVFQGDQPLITPEVINQVLEAYGSSDKGIVIPLFKAKRGHPVLIDRKYRNEIEMLDDKEGLRSLAYRFPSDVHEVETHDSGILRDFDTFEEYKNELNKM
jgi:molybdenum cofactor cytidylyltransferase